MVLVQPRIPTLQWCRIGKMQGPEPNLQVVSLLCFVAVKFNFSQTNHKANSLSSLIFSSPSRKTFPLNSNRKIPRTHKNPKKPQKWTQPTKFQEFFSPITCWKTLHDFSKFSGVKNPGSLGCVRKPCFHNAKWRKPSRKWFTESFLWRKWTWSPERDQLIALRTAWAKYFAFSLQSDTSWNSTVCFFSQFLQSEYFYAFPENVLTKTARMHKPLPVSFMAQNNTSWCTITNKRWKVSLTQCRNCRQALKRQKTLSQVPNFVQLKSPIKIDTALFPISKANNKPWIITNKRTNLTKKVTSNTRSVVVDILRISILIAFSAPLCAARRFNNKGAD